MIFLLFVHYNLKLIFVLNFRGLSILLSAFFINFKIINIFFINPHASPLIFGTIFCFICGNSNPELNNDVWIININNNISKWEKIILEIDYLIPCARIYHTCEKIKYGNYKEMMVIFGGRDSKEKPLNDIW